MMSLWRDSPVPVEHSPFPDDHRYDDIVVGGGLTGLTTALLLARAGRHVGILEAHQIGAVTTGSTTGKLSLLQGTKISRILAKQSVSVAQAYLDANREGQQWLLNFCSTHNVAVQERDAVTYAADERELKAVRDEHEAARKVGLEVRWQDTLDVPFAVHGSTVLKNQAQFNPMDVLGALAEQIKVHGGTLHEGTRMTSASKVGQTSVTTAEGVKLGCENLILATGVPTLDRGLYFAKVEANRSYVLTFTSAHVPNMMLISAGKSVRSIRDVPFLDGEPLLMVGGNGHIVGRGPSERKSLDELREWTTSHFPDAIETHAWSAQDYSSHDGIPFVGKLPRGGGHIYLATGYDKWGLTNAVAAARTISGQILGSKPSWSIPLGRRITTPRGAIHLAGMNARIGIAALKAIARAEGTQLEAEPTEAQGEVGRAGLAPVPVGRSTVAGTTCEVVGICTHLGGTLRWNDAEKTWDCPLHGSRFSRDGAVIEGPATRALAARKRV